MDEFGIQPNTVIYNTLIDYLCKSRDASFAIELFDEMGEKCMPANVIIFNAMLKVVWVQFETVD
jgi:pentatricopeptide repeat protein